MSDTGTNSLIDMEDSGEFLDPEVVLQQILDDPDFIQQVTRTAHEGRETITGYFRIVFKPGEQRQILHVPLTPPLKVIPRVEAHANDQQDIRVRITDRQKFGIRAEVILARATESTRRVLVEVIATESD
jgi:hypothetical protein